MMKRLFTFFLTCILIAGLALPCYAASGYIDKKDGYAAGDVYARFVKNTQWEEKTVISGTAAVTTDDGYAVTVTGIPSEAVVLKVFSIPPSESSAREWMEDCIGGEYDIEAAFDIWFEDTDGNHILADGVQIFIQKCVSDSILFSLSTTGQNEKLYSIKENGGIQFTANGSSYYVLVKDVSVSKPLDSDKSVVSDTPAKPNTTVAIATGDNDHIVIYFISVIAAGIIFVQLFIWMKNTKHK